MVELILNRTKLHRDIRGFDECDVLSTKTDHQTGIKIIVIPGNPGLVEFYIEFIKSLYTHLGSNYDIIGVSHFGHCGLIEESFDLEEQIQHKAIFLEYLLNTRFNLNRDNIKFILIGHSVGSYISLKVLNRYSKQFNIINQINLFPTFRNLYEGLSPFIKVAVQNGFRKPVASFLHYIPSFITNYVLGVILPTDDMRVALKYKLNYWSAMNILYMAYSETLDIKEVDSECRNVFKEKLDNLLFIYGTTDPYTPKSFVEDLLSEYPKGNIEYAQEGVPHAFVLTHSDLVAKRVATWLNTKDHFKS